MPKIKKVFVRKNGVENVVYPTSYQITFLYNFYDWSELKNTSTTIQKVPKGDTPVPIYPTTDYSFEGFDKALAPATETTTYIGTYRKNPGGVYYNASLQLFSVSRDGVNWKTFQDRDYGATTKGGTGTKLATSDWLSMTFPTGYYIPDSGYWGKQQSSASQSIQRSMEIIDNNYNAITLFGFVGQQPYVYVRSGSTSATYKIMCSTAGKIYDYGTGSGGQSYCRLALETPIVPDNTWTKIY